MQQLSCRYPAGSHTSGRNRLDGRPQRVGHVAAVPLSMRTRTQASRKSVQEGLAQRPQRPRTRRQPYIIFSQNKREVTARDVAQLLSAAADPHQTTATPIKAGYFNHWTQCLEGAMRERMLCKLTKCLDKSVAVVMAFTNYDVYDVTHGATPNSNNSIDEDSGGGHDAAGTPSPLPAPLAPGRALGWEWGAAPSGRGARKRSLVGFVRAGGDGSLSATIYDLAVHPAFRGCGVGTKLLKLLTQQLYNKEIYDIGSIVPAECEAFFRANSFEEDREASVMLTFARHRAWAADQLVGTWAAPGQRAWVLEMHQTRERCKLLGNSGVGDEWTIEEGAASSAMPGRCQSPACDPLASVPAPATTALPTSPGLQRLLLDKLERHLQH